MRRFLLLWVPVLLFAGIVLPTGAYALDVVANFDGGGTDALPVTDVVDAYTGMGGLGWDAGWYKYINHAMYTVGTDNTTPLGTGTGNYLDLTMIPTQDTSPGRYGSVSRSYAGGIDVAQSHSIDFKFRVNEDISDPIYGEFITSTDRYQLFDAPDPAQGTVGPNCSWTIVCYGGAATWLDASKRAHWVVFNGDNNDTAASDDRNLDTGITVTQNSVYDFHIDVDAVSKTWDVTISSGGSLLYDSTATHPDGLGWRTSAATVGGIPHFSSYGNDTADVRLYSLDSVKITGVGMGPPGGMSLVAARFTGGGSDAAPVTDVVDAYVGMPGDGWATAWEKATLRADATVAVSTASPVKSGGEYLSVSAVGTTEATMGRAVVARDYKTTDAPGIDWSAEHTIKFTVRIDETTIGDPEFDTFTAFDDRYLMFDASGLQSGPSEAATWMITAYAAEGDYAGAEVVGQWSFYDGQRDDGAMNGALNVDTDVDIVAGGVYDFTIVVDPETRSYNATVSDGVHSFTANDLGWRTSAADVGGYLHFGTRQSDEIDVRAFSLDDLVITTAGVPTVPGDTDGDDDVDADDAAVLATNWGTNVGTGGFVMGDFNGDELVNAADAAILAANWGTHSSTPAAAVPEPSVIVLLLTGSLLLMTGHRRR